MVFDVNSGSEKKSLNASKLLEAIFCLNGLLKINYFLGLCTLIGKLFGKVN